MPAIRRAYVIIEVTRRVVRAQDAEEALAIYSDKGDAAVIAEGRHEPPKVRQRPLGTYWYENSHWDLRTSNWR